MIISGSEANKMHLRITALFTKLHLPHLNQFVMFRANPYIVVDNVYFSESRKFKFSMQTYLTHVNIIFEYSHTEMILNCVDVLYLEDWNRYTCGPVLKNNTATVTIFFSQKPFLVLGMYTK